VWEDALARENGKAADLGLTEARTARIGILPIAPADQDRFERLYLADAARNAAALARYGIDGSATFRTARASIRPDGQVFCRSV